MWARWRSGAANRTSEGRASFGRIIGLRSSNSQSKESVQDAWGDGASDSAPRDHPGAMSTPRLCRVPGGASRVEATRRPGRCLTSDGQGNGCSSNSLRPAWHGAPKRTDTRLPPLGPRARCHVVPWRELVRACSSEARAPRLSKPCLAARERGGPTVEDYRSLIGKSQVRILPGPLAVSEPHHQCRAGRFDSVIKDGPCQPIGHRAPSRVSSSARAAVGASGHWPRATGIRSSNAQESAAPPHDHPMGRKPGPCGHTTPRCE